MKTTILILTALLLFPALVLGGEKEEVFFKTNQLYGLSTNFLPKLGINLGGMHDPESWFHMIPVDWKTAKSLTIKKAEPYYWSERPPGVVYPLSRLLATVDTGTNQLNI